jgi:hypothetical protein
MKYEKIDRSNIDFTSDTSVCNVGVLDFSINDMPIRLEEFYMNDVLCLTIFIPKVDQFIDEETIKKYLVDNNVIEIIKDNIYITEIEDINNNSFISVNVPLETKNEVLNVCKKDVEIL